MLGWETDFESFNGNLIKIATNLVKHLPVLSEYTFMDSLSLIDMDNKESKGWGTLQHVINQEQNDWVSFLKELIEFVLSPLNHLIGIGPKLDENTLHIKASSWEWIAIFCLNWLMCSTGSIWPLYMANDG